MRPGKRKRKSLDNKDKQGEEGEKLEEDPIDRLELEPEQGYDDVGTTTYRSSITGKDMKVVWRNFDHALANLGIKRKLIRTQVRENKEGRI